jgi:glycogen synthase
VRLGVSECEPPPRDEQPARQEAGLRVLTGGRLTHWKGYDLLIEGFAGLVRARPDSDARLVITGTGSFQPHLESARSAMCVPH